MTPKERSPYFQRILNAIVVAVEAGAMDDSMPIIVAAQAQHHTTQKVIRFTLSILEGWEEANRLTGTDVLADFKSFTSDAN